jgi:hypothetical protein
MEARVEQIVRAVAHIQMATDGPCEDYICPFSCGWFDEDCPITLARAVLREQHALSA